MVIKNLVNHTLLTLSVRNKKRHTFDFVWPS